MPGVRHQWIPILLITLFLISGCMAATSMLRQGWKRASGEVVRATGPGRGSAALYRFVVDGQSFEGSCAMPFMYLALQEKVEVQYNPANPASNVLTKATDATIAYGSILFSIAIALAALQFYGKRSTTRTVLDRSIRIRGDRLAAIHSVAEVLKDRPGANEPGMPYQLGTAWWSIQSVDETRWTLVAIVPCAIDTSSGARPASMHSLIPSTSVRLEVRLDVPSQDDAYPEHTALRFKFEVEAPNAVIGELTATAERVSAFSFDFILHQLGQLRRL